jgi:hypothetical protein
LGEWKGYLGLLGNVLRCIGGRKETRRPVIASIQTEPTGKRGKIEMRSAKRPLSSE